MTRRSIVLDANILIRAVLGQRVRDLIVGHAADVSFFAPEIAFEEARQYLPGLLEKRGVRGAAGLAALEALQSVVHPLDEELYRPLEQVALARIGERDPDGRRMPTSSAPAWRRGRPAASVCSSPRTSWRTATRVKP